MLKELLISTSIILTTVVATTGCTARGDSYANHREMSININYSNIINLEPTNKQVEKIYVQTKDLSGANITDDYKDRIIYYISQNPQFSLTGNVSDADIIIYATLVNYSTDRSQGWSGTAIGAGTGLLTGAVVDSSLSYHRRGPYGYHHYHSPMGGLLPLIFMGVGAGIGYAIDSGNSVDYLRISTDIEVRQRSSLSDSGWQHTILV